MNRRVALALTASAVLVVALLFIVRKPAAKTATAVRIAYVGSVTSGPPKLTGALAIVVKDGWLEGELAKRGAKLQWVPMPNANVGPMTNEAFANRSIDLAAYGDLPSIIANAN